MDLDLDTIKEWWAFLLPMFPYIGTVVVTYGLMARGIKPMIARNRDPKTKKFYSKTWRTVRQWMWTYPSVIGVGIGLGWQFSSDAGANVFIHMLCGTASQMIVHFAQDIAKAKGYELELDVRDSLGPPPESDPPAEV